MFTRDSTVFPAKEMVSITVPSIRRTNSCIRLLKKEYIIQPSTVILISAFSNSTTERMLNSRLKPWSGLIRFALNLMVSMEKAILVCKAATATAVTPAISRSGSAACANRSMA